MGQQRAEIDSSTLGQRNEFSWWCITLPPDVPPNAIVIERDGGLWRVVPSRYPTRTFKTREEALAWARAFAATFLSLWRIVEKPDTDTESDTAAA